MAAQAGSIAGAYCPHCHLLISGDTGDGWPSAAARCPHCHLVVGAGRARSAPSSAPGAKGTAAGIFSREAKRSEAEPLHSRAEVLEGIRRAAALLGRPTERLLMVEYQQLSVVEADLPPLSDVLQVFSSWKGARREASKSPQTGRACPDG